MKLKYILCLLVALNSGLIFGAYSNCEEYYRTTYQKLSYPVNPVETINVVLKRAEAFQARGHHSTDRLLARRYLTSEFMNLSKKDLGSVISSNEVLFHDSFFGLSLILGHVLHNNSDENLMHLFKKDSKFKYGDYFESEVKKAKIDTFVKKLAEIKDRLNNLDDLNHYDFYFETTHLPWASKELIKLKPKLIKKDKKVQLSSGDRPEQSFLKRNALLIGCGISIATIGGFILYFWRK